MTETTISYSVREIGEVLNALRSIAAPVPSIVDEGGLRNILATQAAMAEQAMKQLDPDGNVALALAAQKEDR